MTMVNHSENDRTCQIACLPQFSRGFAQVPPESIRRRLRLFVRRSLNVRQVKVIRKKLTPIIAWFQSTLRFQKQSLNKAIKAREVPNFAENDWVRVRSKEEIEATLNVWKQLKGCMFMPEMLPYCGTTQRVFRRLERFVDERDYHVKESRGIVLLEGLYCQGTSDYGRCDRSCFYFWREEWLEKIDPHPTESRK